jgi:hypothetical protein
MVKFVNLLVLAILYTPPEDTFNDILKSGINLPLPSSLLRLQLDVPVNGFGCSAIFSPRGHNVVTCHSQTTVSTYSSTP